MTCTQRYYCSMTQRCSTPTTREGRLMGVDIYIVHTMGHIPIVKEWALRENKGIE